MDTKEFFESNYKFSPLEIKAPVCLFMVDFQVGAFEHSADGMAEETIGPCVRLLGLFRVLKLPIVHFWLDEKKWFQRNEYRRAYVEPYIGSNEIHPLFQAISTEGIIEKTDRSCFFKTGIDNLLWTHQARNIVLMGTTTSGCIRSTVSDGDMRGYNMILPEECVWDQSKEVHDANMFDMKHKYARVLKLGDLEDEITSFASNSRNLE
jgi:nicotinamidase-related amidase